MTTPTLAACKQALRSVVRTGEGWARRLCGSEDLLRNTVPAWQAMPHVSGRLAHVPTMLSTEEINLLYWLTRDRYTGAGAIIDCGPFLGGSTLALCAGLRDNPGTFPRDGVVHSFDHFRYDPFFEPWFKPFGETLADGDDFSHLFRRLTGPYRDCVRVHQGDMCVTPYEGGDVEVLFIDVCKSWEINAAVVARFFRHLVPGRSLVIQQDYVHYYAYWLVITMDFFADYLQYKCRVTDGHSAVFKCVRRIPGRLLEVDLRALPRERKQAAFERALARADGWAKVELQVGYMRMFLDEGDEAGAAAVARRVDPAFHDHPVNRNAFRFIHHLYPHIPLYRAGDVH